MLSAPRYKLEQAWRANLTSTTLRQQGRCHRTMITVQNKNLSICHNSAGHQVCELKKRPAIPQTGDCGSREAYSPAPDPEVRTLGTPHRTRVSTPELGAMCRRRPADTAALGSRRSRGLGASQPRAALTAQQWGRCPFLASDPCPWGLLRRWRLQPSAPSPPPVPRVRPGTVGPAHPTLPPICSGEPSRRALSARGLPSPRFSVSPGQTGSPPVPAALAYCIRVPDSS